MENTDNIIKKTRGRKKKILDTPIVINNKTNANNASNASNVSNASNANKKTTQGNDNRIEEHNESDGNKNDNNLELLKIEQVKKKRGRKKKWEVETTTKLIENGSICFSENNLKQETIPIDDNYKAENILFGNLNIKVHTNKETILVDDIKESLKKKNDSACKINLTNSDYENSEADDDDEYKLSCKKTTHIVEKNIKIMKYFTDQYNNGNEIIISPYRCYHCHHNFKNKPFFLPIQYNSELKRFKVTGNFCSPNCVKAYAINSKLYQNKLYLIGLMYRILFGANYVIKAAAPIQCLKEYGGNLTIQEYRENFDCSKIYSLKNICSKVIMDEIIE